mgnify:CR=1 FL=1
MNKPFIAPVETGAPPPSNPTAVRWTLIEGLDEGTNVYVPKADATGKALRRRQDRLRKRGIVISVHKEDGGHRVYKTKNPSL